MKNDPWVRFGIFIRPKTSEKPADRRKSSPPNVMLLTASTSHTFMAGSSLLGEPGQGGRGPPSALQGRIVARVDGLRQEPLLVVRPELADVRIGLDRRVDELVALALTASDVDVAHDVAEAVEAERPERTVGERDRSQGLAEGLAVVRLPARLLEGGLGHHTVDVETGRVEPGNVAVVTDHAVDEPLVAGAVEVPGVGRRRDQADGLVPVGFQQRVVASGAATQDGELEAAIGVLLHELQRIRAGKALDDGLHAAD